MPDSPVAEDWGNVAVMENRAIGRIASQIITAGGWLVAGARLVLDLIGYSTIPEDTGVAQTRAEHFLTWLAGLPWWAPWGFALVSTLWLMWVSWPRQQKQPKQPLAVPNTPTIFGPPPTYDNLMSENAAGEAVDKVAYNDLVAFSIDVLMPTFEAMLDFYTKLVEFGSTNKEISSLAIRGLYSSRQTNFEAFDKLSTGLMESPGPIIRFEALMDCIHELESGGYWRLRNEVGTLAFSLGQDPPKDDGLKESWNDWVDKHNQLIAAYEAIKRDSRFGKLFRPARESRWGSFWPYDSPITGVSLFGQPQSLPDTGQKTPR